MRSSSSIPPSTSHADRTRGTDDVSQLVHVVSPLRHWPIQGLAQNPSLPVPVSPWGRRYVALGSDRMGEPLNAKKATIADRQFGGTKLGIRTGARTPHRLTSIIPASITAATPIAASHRVCAAVPAPDARSPCLAPAPASWVVTLALVRVVSLPRPASVAPRPSEAPWAVVVVLVPALP